MLPAALQPRGYGCGPIALLSQRLEQVSSGVIHPGAPPTFSPGVTQFFCVHVVLLYTSLRSGNNRPFLESQSISTLPGPRL